MHKEQSQSADRDGRLRDQPYVPRSEQDVLDEDIFESLDAAWPGLEGVMRAYRGNRMEDAKQELLAYFRRRRSPQWFHDVRGTTEAGSYGEENHFEWGGTQASTRESASDVVADADRLVRQQFLGGVLHDLGARWDRFPLYNLNDEDDKPLRVTANRFVRMNFIKPLVVAYYHTRKPEYAETLAAMLEAFTEKLLKQDPYVPDPVPSEEAYTIHFSKNPFRSNMSLAQSALNVVHLMYTDLFYSEWIPYRLAFRLFRYAWYVMDHHRSYDNNRYRHYNHHLFERGTAPLIFSIMFPEFPGLRPLQDRGRTVIEAHLLNDFHATGGYDEHSFAYTCHTTMSEFLLPVKQLADLNGVRAFGEEGDRTLNRVISYYSGLVMPEGGFPDVGDAGGGSAQGLLKQGAEQYGNRTARAVLNALELHVNGAKSKDDERSALPPVAVNDPLTGYLCARESWTKDSSFMLMCNKIYTRHCSHNHIDMLSLILAVRGEKMIGEPQARILYKYVSNHSALDDYLRGLGSHNTVQIHGRTVTKSNLQRQQRMASQTVSTEAFECRDDGVYVRASHHADQNGSHTREVLFVHQVGWVIADTINQAGAAMMKPHVQRWHLEHGVSAERAGTAEHALLLRGPSSRMLCVWPAEPAVTINLWKQESVLAIESVPDYKDVSDLPWIIDVGFGPQASEPSESAHPSCRLPCLFIDVTDEAESMNAIVAQCRALLDSFDNGPLPVREHAFARRFKLIKDSL